MGSVWTAASPGPSLLDRLRGRRWKFAGREQRGARPEAPQGVSGGVTGGEGASRQRALPAPLSAGWSPHRLADGGGVSVGVDAAPTFYGERRRG